MAYDNFGNISNSKDIKFYNTDGLRPARAPFLPKGPDFVISSARKELLDRTITQADEDLQESKNYKDSDSSMTAVNSINYKFNEDKLIEEFRSYINQTYSAHYAQDKNLQSLEVIFSRGWGEGFTHGSIDKYNARYGKKEGYNRKDLQKILHYALLALYVHDQEHQ